MSDLRKLTTALGEPGTWTFAYVDGPGPDPQVEEEAKQDAVHRRLSDSGATDAAVDAVMSCVTRATGMPAPSARYIAARDGDVVVDAAFPEPRVGPEEIGTAALPPLLPMLRHGAETAGYLVVEAARDGAHLTWGRADRQPEALDDVEGDADALSKVRGAGLAHSRYQRSAEENWKANQSEVAEAVDRVVRERQPAFVVIAGDVRARQLLQEQLAPASREIAVEVDAHTAADGTDDAALDRAITEAIADRIEGRAAAARDRAAAADGERGARGTEEVMAALQQAQVETLLLDVRLWESDHTLDALETQPWVGDGRNLDVGVVDRVSAPEALARAALLTDARVIVEEDEPAGEDEPRRLGEPDQPLAALRWSAG